MKNYYLFLDESKPNSNFSNFTLGGIVIEKNIYESILKSHVNNMKINCFGNDDFILHEIDIRSKKGEFSKITKDIQENFFGEMKEIFEKNYFEVLAVTINIDELENLYDANSRNDIYYIALQLLLENFAHFLKSNNGIGSIYLESTDQSNDSKLQNLYYSLLATGTLFLKKEFLQERLKTINFSIKSDNIIGLQIADFIPNAIARNALKKKEKPYSLLKNIQAILYDGKIGKADRFGCKEIS
ncbi:DUF3800 domain-containing protein [Anaerosporobacter sp.]|uniref:DUF3800 domain-containing protein n=1 Tax=Anaerosporobacter sp. TaxID=1872529 RepID=UPI00286EE287|nr:DUF3800 domain-containing protein [Anaerosporobacter sp.]